MRALIVLCHPSQDSFAAQLWDGLIEAIGRHHDVKALNLYGGNGHPPSPTTDDLAGCAAVVLVYPTWWAGFPAPLQAWVEHHLELQAWGHVERIVGVTTHGSGRVINLFEGRPGRQMIRRGLPWAAAPGARGSFVAMYGIDRASQGARTAFRRRAIGRVLSELAR